MLRRILPTTLALLTAWSSCSTDAIAAEPNHLTEARSFANGAADDLEASRFQDALEKAKRAEQLYHAPPHLLMMAEAYEGLGRLVEALDTYERLAAEPLSPTAPAAFRKAREVGAKKEQHLLSRVPSILVDITGAPSEDAKASVDGRTITLRSGVATRLDPGKHTVRVETEGFKPHEVIVVLAERGGVTKVPIQLEVDNARRTPNANLDESNHESSAQRFVAPTVITLGLGTAALTAGIVTGLLSISKVNELEGKCLAGSNHQYRCSTQFEPLMNETRRLSDISTSTFVVGGVAIGVGITLLIAGRPRRTTNSAFHVEPIVGLGEFGIRGKF